MNPIIQMSGNRKVHSSIELSRKEEATENNYTTFSLEKEESCNLPLDSDPMRMESEDHLENLFSGHCEPPSFFQINEIKQEISEIDYIYTHKQQKSEKETTLNDYYEKVKKLIEKCRIVQQLIFVTAKEPIYSYSLGFETDQDSDKEEEQPDSLKNYESWSICKEEAPFQNLNIKEENESIIAHLIKAEEESSFGTKEYPGLKEEQKTATVITLSSFSSQLSTISWVLELASKCHYKPLNHMEKRQFLELLNKLESMKRGLSRAIVTVNENDHRCKFCGIKFQTGRKLGGHISRKHPGNSFDYEMKKEVRKTKICERNRRNYLRNLKEKREIHEN